jgi:hypothetical protein
MGMPKPRRASRWNLRTPAFLLVGAAVLYGSLAVSPDLFPGSDTAVYTADSALEEVIDVPVRTHVVEHRFVDDDGGAVDERHVVDDSGAAAEEAQLGASDWSVRPGAVQNVDYTADAAALVEEAEEGAAALLADYTTDAADVATPAAQGDAAAHADYTTDAAEVAEEAEEVAAASLADYTTDAADVVSPAARGDAAAHADYTTDAAEVAEDAEEVDAASHADYTTDAADVASPTARGGAAAAHADYTTDAAEHTEYTADPAQAHHADYTVFSAQEEADQPGGRGDASEAAPSPDQQYHVIVSVGEGIYTEWQVRVVSPRDRPRCHPGRSGCAASAEECAAARRGLSPCTACCSRRPCRFLAASAVLLLVQEAQGEASRQRHGRLHAAAAHRRGGRLHGGDPHRRRRPAAARPAGGGERERREAAPHHQRLQTVCGSLELYFGALWACLAPPHGGLACRPAAGIAGARDSALSAFCFSSRAGVCGAEPSLRLPAVGATTHAFDPGALRADVGARSLAAHPAAALGHTHDVSSRAKSAGREADACVRWRLFHSSCVRRIRRANMLHMLANAVDFGACLLTPARRPPALHAAPPPSPSST